MSDSKVKINVSDSALDQLRESINIGAAHASTALSQLTKKKVVITVPELHIDDVDSSLVFMSEDLMSYKTVLVKILGDMRGLIFFLFPDDSGKKLAKLINGFEDKEGERFTESDNSALREVGNILSGACLTAFSKFIGISLIHSVAKIADDLDEPVIKEMTEEIKNTSEIVITFKVRMRIEDHNVDIETQLFFLMGPEFTQRVLTQTSGILGQ